MRTGTPLSARLQFWRNFLIFEILIIGVVGLACLLLGWNSLTGYANGLFLAGALLMIFGSERVFSLQKVDRSFNVRYPQTAGSDGAQGSARRLLKESEAMFASTWRTFLVGIVPILGSLVVSALAANS
jgi:hypothetical protein